MSEHRWYVTVEAFGHIVCEYVNASTQAEAEKKLLDRVGFKLVSKDAS